MQVKYLESDSILKSSMAARGTMTSVFLREFIKILNIINFGIVIILTLSMIRRGSLCNFIPRYKMKQKLTT